MDLAPVSDDRLVPNAIASALSISEEPGRSLAATLVAGACATLVEALLRGCPDISGAVGAGGAGGPLATSSARRVFPTPGGR